MAILAAMTSVANAQVKSVSAAQSAAEKAKAEIENPKKNTKVATWLKYGKAMTDAYDAPAGSGWLNASRQELQLVSGSEKPSSVESVVIGGQNWEKEVYPTRNYYFNPAGQLALIEITKPIYPDALDKALEVLGQLSEGKRLVGIISHVEQLEECIPQKIRVESGEQGSRLRIEGA